MNWVRSAERENEDYFETKEKSFYIDIEMLKKSWIDYIILQGSKMFLLVSTGAYEVMCYCLLVVLVVFLIVLA